jgi:thiaminase
MPPTPGLAAALSAEVTAAATAWLELPMLAGIRRGDLDPAIFRHYLEQDFVYLRYYARLYSRLAAGAATDEELEMFVVLAHGVVAVELDHHRRAAEPFGCDFGDVRPSAETTTYLGFYDSLAADRAATLVAMLPCIQGYGVALSGLRDVAPGPYQDWIGIYAGGAYADLVERHLALVDACGLPEDRAREVLGQALELERLFWNQLPAVAEAS